MFVLYAQLNRKNMYKLFKPLCIILTLAFFTSCKKDSSPEPAAGFLTLKVGSYEETHTDPTFIQRQLSTTDNAYSFTSKPGSKYPAYISIETNTLQVNKLYTINSAGGGKFLYQFSGSHALDAPNNGYFSIEFTKISNNRASGKINGEISETGSTYPITGTFENVLMQ